jgi:hypothetical protein
MTVMRAFGRIHGRNQTTSTRSKPLGRKAFRRFCAARFLLACTRSQRQGPMSEQELAEHEIRSVAGESRRRLALDQRVPRRLTASGVAGILKEVERGIKQIETLTKKLEPGK